MDKLSVRQPMILVEGEKYQVIDDLGWQEGYYRKFVLTPNGERMVKKIGGHWYWCTNEDMRVKSIFIGGGYVGQ